MLCQCSKTSPIFITEVKNISPLIQLLEKITKQKYEIKTLADNQVKFQPKNSARYGIIVKVLSVKSTEFHTYKLKEERCYKVVLKICRNELKTDI
jgi:hypothetical protein